MRSYFGLTANTRSKPASVSSLMGRPPIRSRSAEAPMIAIDLGSSNAAMLYSATNDSLRTGERTSASFENRRALFQESSLRFVAILSLGQKSGVVLLIAITVLDGHRFDGDQAVLHGLHCQRTLLGDGERDLARERHQLRQGEAGFDDAAPKSLLRRHSIARQCHAPDQRMGKNAHGVPRSSSQPDIDFR